MLRWRSWQTWVIEIPAIIVTVWYRAYIVVLALGSLILWSMLLTGLVLWFGFGVRWGW